VSGKSKSWRRLGLVALALVVVGSVGAVAVMWNQSMRVLAKYHEVRLDPTHAERFIPDNASLAPPAAGQPRIVLMGDSRLDEWSEPAISVEAQIVNRAQSGDTTGQVLLRLDRDVIALSPRVVVLQVGINDLQAIGMLPDGARAIRERTIANLRSMVQRLRAADIHVLITSIFPVGPIPVIREPVWSDETLQAVDATNEALRELEGPGVTYLDCDELFRVDGRMDPRFAADEFHLTDAAYGVLGEALTAALRQILDADAVQ